WKAALDCTVIKKGVFCLVFHPWGWIRNDQVVELIDYAAAKYGKKVKFLNFREALERLNNDLLVGKALREPVSVVEINPKGEFGIEKTGSHISSALVLDLNNDGYMDLIQSSLTRIWSNGKRTWQKIKCPDFGQWDPSGFGSLGQPPIVTR